MTLHIFNPEHDLALAANLSNFTAPHAGRQLRADLGFIPALWAAEDDRVLVENVEDAEHRFLLLAHRPFHGFIEKEQIWKEPITGVSVWGWDPAICAFLRRQGVEESLLPTEAQTATIRELSSRRYAMQLLSQLREPRTVGEAMMATTVVEVERQLVVHGHIVVKAPWSSSGRGVRFMEATISSHDTGWVRNVIDRQGAVMVEPYYKKVEDFGMEFESDGEGRVSYLGLSLFQTSGGAYTGNVLASEEDKQGMISSYIPTDLLNTIQEKICAWTGALFKGRYQGPFGVDMMVVARENEEGFLLHPCVEINLRRTMGHVALSLTPFLNGLPKTMCIDYENNRYKICVKR